MSRLTDDLHAALTPDVLDTLFSKSIFTNLCFIRTNPELLAKTTGLQYNQILQIKDHILSKYSSTLRNGYKCYMEFLNHSAILPTGITAFDSLLDGGLMTGGLYELCGFAGCGKTQICMTTAANICATTQQQVYYIDTKNDITGQRVFEILENHNIPNAGDVMQKIQISHIKNAYELLQLLHQLDKKILNIKGKYLGFKLIILDSLSAIFQQFHDQIEGLSILNHVASLLKYICVEYHLTVLLTNYVSSWTADGISSETDSEDEQGNCFQQVQQPALGKYWSHVPNTRIMIKKLDGSNECFLIILKSLSFPVGKSVKVTIGNDGVT